MGVLVAACTDEPYRQGHKTAAILRCISGAPCDSQKTPIAAEILQRRPIAWICARCGADDYSVHGIRLDNRANSATLIKKFLAVANGRALIDSGPAIASVFQKNLGASLQRTIQILRPLLPAP
jgi:hypothetical protein